MCQLCVTLASTGMLANPYLTISTMRLSGFLSLSGLAVAACSPSLPAQEPTPQRQEAPKEPPHVKPAVNFEKFKFMEGCWAGEVGKDQTVEEIWTSPAENLLVSTTRYYTKKWATSYDFNRIEAVDSTVVFGIKPKGKDEDIYTLKTLADEYFVFENPTKKEFPQRIIYRMAADGALIPRNEGDGPSFELRFHRVKCPGADKKE